MNFTDQADPGIILFISFHNHQCENQKKSSPWCYSCEMKEWCNMSYLQCFPIVVLTCQPNQQDSPWCCQQYLKVVWSTQMFYYLEQFRSQTTGLKGLNWSKAMVWRQGWVLLSLELKISSYKESFKVPARV